MKHLSLTTCVFGLALVTAQCPAANNNDATTELFSLLSKGGCEPSALVGKTWTISTSPVGTHGELLLGDVLEFSLVGKSTGISKKSAIEVMRNGVIWNSINGWTGQCVRDGNLSLYVVSGDVDVAGCAHDLAIGRLDHDDNLSNKIEVVFQDSDGEASEECLVFNPLHPGHAHGAN